MSEENLENKPEVKEEAKQDENEELTKTEKELEETVDRLKRVMAEFENYKKRNTKERENLYNSLLADIVSSFLPVLDNLEKAAEAKTEDENMKQGIELVVKQIQEFRKGYKIGPKVIRHSMVIVAN